MYGSDAYKAFYQNCEIRGLWVKGLGPPFNKLIFANIKKNETRGNSQRSLIPVIKL